MKVLSLVILPLFLFACSDQEAVPPPADASCLTVSAETCQPQQEDLSKVHSTPAVERKQAPLEPREGVDGPKDEKKDGDECSEYQHIPIWEGEIEFLFANHCFACHNQAFAVKDVLLDDYDDVVDNAEVAVRRIRARNLTLPLTKPQEALFLFWFDLGMPRSSDDRDAVQGSLTLACD